MKTRMLPADASMAARYTAAWLNTLGQDEEMHRAGARAVTFWQIRLNHIERGLVVAQKRKQKPDRIKAI